MTTFLIPTTWCIAVSVLLWINILATLGGIANDIFQAKNRNKLVEGIKAQYEASLGGRMPPVQKQQPMTMARYPKPEDKG